ncbi:MAG: PilZ domain-containing protein [Gallionellaceae bacterium]|jgi:hypothetical protein
MADENTIPPATIEASELPPNAVEDNPSVTVAEPGNAAPEVAPVASPKAVEDIVPVTLVVPGDVTPGGAPDASAKSAKYEEPHSEPHPHFRWHADALVEGHVYHGLVKDISTKGVSLLLDHNLQNAKFVKLHIHVPPLDVTSPHHVLEVSGKITSSIYDGDEDAFRSGVVFLQFTRETDRTYLQSRMLER